MKRDLRLALNHSKISKKLAKPYLETFSVEKIIEENTNTQILLRRLTKENALLKKAKDEAEKECRAKDLFLAMLSHELRTPLTTIMCWTQFLKKQPIDNKKITKAIQSISENAAMQNQLINDLLDVSSIIKGKIHINFQPLDIAALVKNSIDSFLPVAEKKMVAMISAIQQANIFVYADPARMRQAISNLIANAIKFTPPEGHIKITLNVIQHHSRQFVVIKISDTGIGIKPDFLPYVFDKFKQAESSYASTHGSLGLGLTITRSLLKLQNSTIEAHSLGENMGATFTVTIPILSSRDH